MKHIRTILSPVMALVLTACGGQQQQNGAQEGTVALPRVETMVAAAEEVPQEAVYSTHVQAYAINHIAPQSVSRIQKMNVDVGDYVSRGQVLAEMDRLQLDQAALKLKNDETELARVKQLLAEGGVSQADYDQLELAFQVSKGSYDNLLENTILRSPIDGVVTARGYDRGDMYTMGQPIYTVEQITPVKILVGVSESDYTRVKRGDSVSLTADALGGKTFTGQINRLYPTMDAASHTFNVEVVVRNADRQLRPGMYARVTVRFGSRRSVVVPDMAVRKIQGSGQRTVYTVEADGTVAVKPVTPGRRWDGKYEILSGLQEGEQIIVKGHTAVRAGDKVEVAAL
ncbi:MAG: efflux RND transporter periplasmic adaptor subunit [Bacteroidales bacterium]|nr:efflux RND transporter periplasmic adaptor subunit [Bacteroidales bacterium]